jgi:NAD(P)-dependent dehydrogenase (short-subunit alcohol dehydrogenase family)
MRVLITGGSRGIGKAIVERFICDGHDVYCPTREELDLSHPVVLNDCSFDIVINNAGINPLKKFCEISSTEVMRVNYLSPLEIIQQCIPHMVERRFGRIINIGSIWIDLAKEKRSAYAASKSALHSMTLSLTAEYASMGILSNTVSPGFIETDLTRKNNSSEELIRLSNIVPVKRLGLPEEVAELVYFLTIKNTFISGQNIRIDGGYQCTAH